MSPLRPRTSRKKSSLVCASEAWGLSRNARSVVAIVMRHVALRQWFSGAREPWEC